jgi:hypothetical protein
VSHFVVRVVLIADAKLPRNPNWDYNTLTVEDVFRAIESNPGQIDVSLIITKGGIT